jgi:hypothetical protein
VYLNGTRFVLDCPYVDEQIKDATFTFGIVREILIRNCYLRDGVSKCAKTAHTVLDLGANRGVFSVMMACHAELVISVECQPVFQKVIAHSMGLNGFTNYRIETAFVGGGGACDNTQRRRVTVPELLQKHGLESVDLIKIDIEGSEFSLFQSPEWLDLVSAICMEVHPQFGDVGGICHALSRCGFSVVARDRYFRAVEDPQRADFVYAWRQHIASRGPRL